MSRDIKIMVVAPGAQHSTFDVFKYYLDAMRDDETVSEVTPFNFHNTLIYHRTATEKLFPYYSRDDLLSVCCVRAARDLILDVIIYKPDVVFVVAGTMIPHEVYRELLNIRHELDRPFMLALYLTECPYMDDMQSIFAKYADVLFINDKYSLKTFDPGGTLYVDYLPHSFNPKVHYPGSREDGLLDSKYFSDVLFGGTAFRERVDMLAGVDWQGIDLRLLGTWREWADSESGKKLLPYTRDDNILVHNLELADYYRGAKIALNVHRTREDVEGESEELNNYTDAYSMGPRLYEAAACGSFILTDYRREAEDVFGDTIDFFETHEQLEAKLKYWLDPQHEQERINKAEAARLKIQDCTFGHRLTQYILPVFREILQLRRIKDG